MNITLKNLTRYYGKVLAVDHINLEVRHGQILGFLGPNGAGKTTTMKMITSYLAPSSGQVLIGDINVEENPDEARRHIGYLPENNPLYQDMFVVDFLDYMAALADVPRGEINRRRDEMIEVCGLHGVRHKRIAHLSKGYQQRVGLAQALIHDPEILILDEPTTGLDPRQIIEIRELIKQIGREKTVLLSSHILAEVEATCDRVVIINKGRLIADGTAADLRMQLSKGERYRIQVANRKIEEVEHDLKKLPNLQSYKVLDAQQNVILLQGRRDVEFAKDIFNFAVQQGWILTLLSPEQTKLEDIFIQLTSEN